MSRKRVSARATKSASASPPASAPFGVAMIGAGLMGSVHLKGLERIVGDGLLPVAVSAVADSNLARARAAAAPFGAAAFADPLEAIAHESTRAVVIAVPTDLHLPLARAAVRAGKAIFLEKPLGRDLAEARTTARLLEAAPATHQIGLILRFSPTYNVLRALLAEPANGEMLFCRFRDDQNMPVGGTRYRSSWRGDVARAGGGTLLEHSIHDVDVMNWFFGPARVKSATFQDSEYPGIERLAALELAFEGGGAGQLASVWHRNTFRENERDIEIFCEKRTFRTDGGFSSPIVVESARGRRVLDKEEIESRFRKMIGWRDAANADFPCSAGYEMYVFLERAMRGAPGAVPVGIGLEAHRVIDAAYRMARKGRSA